MDTLGQHLLVEYEGCERRVLNCPQAIEAAMREAAEAAGATIVDTTFQRFSPQGVSGVVVVEESHLSIHTWPEYGYAAVDFYTCGDCLPLRAHAVLRKHLRSSRAEWLVVRRGRRRLLQVEQHQVEAHAATAVSTNVGRPAHPRQPGHRQGIDRGQGGRGVKRQRPRSGDLRGRIRPSAPRRRTPAGCGGERGCRRTSEASPGTAGRCG